MKKILVVHNKYRETGGEDLVVDKEVDLLKEKYIVETLYFDNEINNYIKQFIYFLLNNNFSSNKKILQKINSFNPDLVYFHNSWFKISLGIFKILIKKKIKIIIKIHNFRYFCTKSYFARNHVNKYQTCNACGFVNKKNMFNKYYKDSFLKSLLVNYYGKKYFKLLNNQSIQKVVLTNFHKKFLVNLGFSSREIHIIPNYINASDDVFKIEKKNTITYAGRISYEKGVKELIQSFLNAKLDNFTLQLIGDGPELKYLKKQYENYNIKFLGQKNHKEVIKIIKSSSLVVTATKLFEGQPTLLCEASINKIPALFPDSGGIREFFPEKNPMIFKQFDYVDLEKKLQSVIYGNQLTDIGKENYEFIRQFLDKNKIFNQFEKCFNE